MLEKKSFVMSMYANQTDLYKAKAKYYEEQAEKLEMALAVAQETVSHLEVTTLKLAQGNDDLKKSLDKITSLVNDLKL